MKIPFFNELDSAQTVLLAGAGGGYDLFTGLPLYHWLKRAGKTVHLANLTFSELTGDKLERPVPALARIDAESHLATSHCPELHLARWLADRSDATPIYA